MSKFFKICYVMIMITLTGCWNSAKVLEFKNESIDGFRRSLNISDKNIQESVIHDVFVYPSISYTGGDTYKGIYDLRIVAFSYKKDKKIKITKVELNQIDFATSKQHIININEFLIDDKIYFGAVSVSKKNRRFESL